MMLSKLFSRKNNEVIAKYDNNKVAATIGKNTEDFIKNLTPWFLRNRPKLAIILAAVLMDAVTTYVTFVMKLSMSPVLIFVLTASVAFLSNVPMEFAGLHLRDYEARHKKIDMVLFISIIAGFVVLQIPMVIIKFAVAPDILGLGMSLAGDVEYSDNDKMLMTGVALLMSVEPVVSTLVCFSIGYKSEEDPIRKKKIAKILATNANYTGVRIPMKAAEIENGYVNEQELKGYDRAKKIAHSKKIATREVLNKIKFRKKLAEEGNFTPDDQNDLYNECDKVVDEFKQQRMKVTAEEALVALQHDNNSFADTSDS
ncbi:MAG: hypothetical protein E7514_02655 [Ruminococcaceae bacterium]|nr:hypothetical protein [Oscillospiraceae bacterium]